MGDEGYITSSTPLHDVKGQILALVNHNGGDGNKQGQLCALYLLDPAKGVKKHQCLERGICLIRHPLISKPTLRMGASTMPWFTLKMK